jgi:hypothetical protein
VSVKDVDGASSRRVKAVVVFAAAAAGTCGPVFKRLGEGAVRDGLSSFSFGGGPSSLRPPLNKFDGDKKPMDEFLRLFDMIYRGR